MYLVCLHADANVDVYSRLYRFVILAVYIFDLSSERVAQLPDHIAQAIKQRVPEVLSTM